MAEAVEDLCNMVLVEIGYRPLISDIFEGSRASRVALEVYGQTRDELLDAHDWPFARRTRPLTLLKGPPPPGGYNAIQVWTTFYPKPGWLYEYLYPADCLEFMCVIPPPHAMFDLPLPVAADPRPFRRAHQRIATRRSSPVCLRRGCRPCRSRHSCRRC